MTDSAIDDVSSRQQETAFNDAAAVLNDESASSTTQLERFDELRSIIAFLERPTVLWQSRIDSSSPVLKELQSFADPPAVSQTPLKTFTFPYDLMKVGGKAEKIMNFEWFKTDVKLRILINANPFIAGRLYITYSPMDDTIFPYAQINRKGRVGVTSYPGVEIDLQTNTAAELLVPWINEADAAKTSVDSQKLFRVDIWQLTPLLVADNSLKIPITVFASFANISLKFPTPLTNGLPQGKVQAAEAKGAISEVASGISNIAGKLTKLPVVGTIASKAKWASDLVGGVASVFGWSRPIEGSHSQPFTYLPGRGMSQFKAKDSAVVLGMSNDNEIAEEANNFVSTVDEMSIEHICSRPGLIDVVDWTTSQDFNTQLSSYNVNRETIDNTDRSTNSKFFTVGTSSFRALDSTLAEYTLDNFHMYRADWHFRISLVKTAFHVGRLEFVFIPNVSYFNLPASTDTTNAYRQIFDITEQNEFEFVVPFNHKNIMFRRDYQNTGSNPTVGTLYIRVNSPLTCPDTVSQSIKILVWKYATNVAASFPILNGNLPTVSPVVPQGTHQGIDVNNQNKNVKYVIFDDENSMKDSMKATTVVGGENCINMREATRSFRYALKFSKVAGTPSFYFPNILSNDSRGYLGMCANMYYFYRGGLSYKFISDTPQSLYSCLTVFPEHMENVIETFSNCPFHYTPSDNTVHEISVPFYSETRRQVCNDSRGVNTKGRLDLDVDRPFVLLQTANGADIEGGALFIGAKDDLTFGFLIGVPVMNARFYK